MINELRELRKQYALNTEASETEDNQKYEEIA